MLANDILYAAYKAKDTRFDGRFFIGISSTGIYCRPVCRAKQPKPENCAFFVTAAEAEQAGYRPCLLCRPELAPGASVTDRTAALAHRAAMLLEENCGTGMRLAELSLRLGCTDRHLRRTFAAEYHVSPVQYLQTCRLLLAKNLLTDTCLPVLDVAMASGFGSLRRFNDAFQNHYRMSPTAMRKSLPADTAHNGEITLALGYRPPYRFDEMISFLGARAVPGVEAVRRDEYSRTVHLATSEGTTVSGWIRIANRPKRNMLTVTLSEALLRVLPQVLSRVRHLFDLCCDPFTIYETLSPMNHIRSGICSPGTRLPGCFHPFEMAVRAILGQQITVKGATTLAGRLVTAFGTPVQTGIEGLTHIFPTPEAILALGEPIESHLGPLGIIATRARTIYALAGALASGKISLDLCAQPEAEIKKLMEIPGIGSWTAQYIAMRTMGFTDAFLETDVGVKKALEPYNAKELLQMAESWRPWRSYATINLWNSLHQN